MARMIWMVEVAGTGEIGVVDKGGMKVVGVDAGVEVDGVVGWAVEKEGGRVKERRSAHVSGSSPWGMVSLSSSPMQ